MKSIQDKILYNARRQIQAFQKTKTFFDSASPFDGQYKTDSDSDHYANKLFEELGLNSGKKIDKKFEWFNTLLANLFWNWKNARKRYKPVFISRNESDWLFTRYNKISKFIIDAMDALHEQDYIEMQKGFNVDNDPRKTRIWPTKKLLKFFPVNPMVTYKPVELVELRELDSNKLIDYKKDTGKSRQVRKVLEKINCINNKAKIWHPNEGLISVHLVAIFKQNFSLYGRIHTKAPGHVQGLPTEERRRLVIDNHPVVELDFSALHPHLLYATEGIQIHGDPYLVGDADPILRPVLKILLMAMLHSTEEKQTVKAVNHWLYENPDEKQKLIDAGFLKRWQWDKTGKQSEWKRIKVPIEDFVLPLVEQFMEVHKPIAHHFFTGKETGLRIMNLDASIALNVLKQFADMGTPCISVHDSFVVPALFEKQLRQAMQKAYSKVTKGYRCPIKREYEPLQSDVLVGLETKFYPTPRNGSKMKLVH